MSSRVLTSLTEQVLFFPTCFFCFCCCLPIYGSICIPFFCKFVCSFVSYLHFGLLFSMFVFFFFPLPTFVVIVFYYSASSYALCLWPVDVVHAISIIIIIFVIVLVGNCKLLSILSILWLRLPCSSAP